MKKNYYFFILILLIFFAGFGFLYISLQKAIVDLNNQIAGLNKNFISEHKNLINKNNEIKDFFNKKIIELEDKNNQLIQVLDENDKNFSKKLTQIKIQQKKDLAENLKTNISLNQELLKINKNLLEEKNRKEKLITKWSKMVAKIECTKKTKTVGKGSGAYFSSKVLKTKFDDNGVIITNDHLIKNPSGYADECKITFLNDKDNQDLIEKKDQKIYKVIDVEKDISFLRPSQKIDLSDDYNFCDKALKKGEQVLILGYPAIGSKNDITITEGIISGYEDGYYVTDAKIAKGNSGGAAISVKDDCYLGIPTFVMKGSLETMGRVLDINEMLDKIN